MKTVEDFIEKQPNVVFMGLGEGMGKTGIMISFHNDFSDYTEFMRKSRLMCKDTGMTLDSFIVSTDKLLRTLDMFNAVEVLIEKKLKNGGTNNKNEYSNYYKRKVVDS